MKVFVSNVRRTQKKKGQQTMESMKKPRTAMRPADYENGTAKTSESTPYNTEAVEAAAQRVRAGMRTAKIRDELAKSTRVIQRGDVWDDKPTREDILEFYDDSDDLARQLTDPRESGNAD